MLGVQEKFSLEGVWRAAEIAAMGGQGIAGETEAPVPVEILEYWRFQTGRMTTKDIGRCGMMPSRAYQPMCVVKTVMPEKHGCPSPLETSETELL